MKIPSKIWSVVLFNFRDYNEDEPSPEIYKMTQVANLYQYDYLETSHTFYDTTWEICKDLKEINLEDTPHLKEEFFKGWQKVNYSTKLSIFKGLDFPKDESFTKEIRQYFLKNLIQYPTVSEIYRFRKEISQDKLKEALNNLFEQTEFMVFKNNLNNKEDYWENHINGTEPNKLLDLLELSGLKKEELKKFNKIGFFNPTRQERYNKINEEESTLPIIENKEHQVYLLTIKINTVMLTKHEDNLSLKILDLSIKYLTSLMKFSLGIEKLESDNEFKPLKFIAYDKESYNSAIIKRDAITKWIEENPKLLIERIKNIKKQNKTYMEIEEEIKELSQKIILKEKLENKLIPLNINLEKKHKI